MVTSSPPDKEIDGNWFRWNVRKNQYEPDEYKNRYLQRKKVSKTDRNYTKAIAAVILLDAQAISGLIEGTFGINEGNFDRLFRETSKIPDAEIILGIAVLAVTVSAGAFAGRVGALRNKNKLPSVEEMKSNPKFKEIFPKNDVNLDSAILTYKTRYENASNFTRAKMNATAVDYESSRIRTKYNKAVSDKDPVEIEKAQKEIDKFGNGEFSEAKREYKEQELKMEKMERLENEAITEGERESVLQSLREETGNDTERGDWMALFRLKNKRNPTRDELYEFTLGELKTQAESGEAPTIIGEWYDRYGGGNEEGVSTDLQELGRRVMSLLDGGTGEIENPTAQFLMENFSGAEREALETAYNNPSIWNKLKADYKTYLAGTTALGVLGGGVGAIASQDTNEITVEGQEPKDIEEIIEEEEEKDEDEMDLVESTDRPEEFIKKGEEEGRDEEFIKKGEEEEVVVKPDGSTEIIDEEEGLEDAEKELDIDPEEEDINAEAKSMTSEDKEEEEGLEEAEKELDIDPDTEKEKGIDRLIPSGEPEPDIEEKDISTNPEDDRRKGVDTIIDDDRRKGVDTIIEQDQNPSQTAPTLAKPDQTLGPPPTNITKNFSDLVKICSELSKEVYKKNIYESDSKTILLDYSTPVLIRRDRGKLFIAVRGSKTLANWISNLTLYSPVLGRDRLTTYPEFKFINEKNPTRFHSGFLEVITYGQTATRLNQVKLEGSIPLYNKVRREIDNQRQVVNEVIFTGHSLGGAVASILYYLYQNDYNRLEKKVTHSRCITFGAPRFVKRGYEDGYNSSCPNLFRCWNKKDIVPYTPLYNPIDGFGFLSGFIHCGRGLCLDEPSITQVNINRYTTDIIKDNTPLKIALRGSNIKDGKKMRDLLISKQYQVALIGSVLTAFGNVKIKGGINEKVIYSMESNLKPKVENAPNYLEKCTVLGNCGFEDYLKSVPTGEDPRQQDYTVLGIFGSVFRTLTIEAHDINVYIENVNKIISKEVEKNTSILYTSTEKTMDVDIDEIINPKPKEIINKITVENDEILGFTLETIKEDEMLIISY